MSSRSRRRLLQLLGGGLLGSIAGCSDAGTDGDAGIDDDAGTTGDAGKGTTHTDSTQQTANDSTTGVPLFRVFEKQVTNDKSYSNKFDGVTLETTFTSPSGNKYDFWGFYDGAGGNTGNVWKLRFMPDEVGTWSYTWSFSDRSKFGSGTFDCISSGGGPGVVQPYTENSHWWAYNKNPLSTFGGTDPVFIKSYFISPSGENQDLDWVAPNMYDRLLDAGYNHIQCRDLLKLNDIKEEWWYQDSDAPDSIGKYLYSTSGDPTTMNLDVWHELERHMNYLNQHDMLVQMFVGFDGKNRGQRWRDMSDSEQNWFVKYVVARLSPFANIAGYNYAWETDGNDDDGDLELARLLQTHDLWNHGRTYHDRFYDNGNNHDFGAYTFGAVENHGPGDKHAPLSHNNAAKNKATGKPVYVMEGNGLWRSFWDATEENVIDNIWAVTTGGGSFTWNDADGGNEGGDKASDLFSRYSNAIDAIDYMVDVVTRDLDWYRMDPRDDLLSNHDTGQWGTHCLADPGRQYLVIEYFDSSFDLTLESGTYSGFWMDTHTGNRTAIDEFSTGGGARTFTTPASEDFVMVLTT